MPTSAATASSAPAHKSWLAVLITSLLFLIVCLSWGTTWLGIKIAVESVPPLTAAGLRFLIAFPLFLGFAWLRHEPIVFPRGRAGFGVFVTLAYFSLPYYLLNYGEMHVSSGLTALLFSSMPVFILIFSSALLGERIHLAQVVGILIGFASLFMIITGQGLHVDRAELFGVLAILAAALMHALCYVVTKQKGAAIRVITYNTLPIGCAGLMLLLAGLWLEQPDFGAITPRSWAALSYLGLVGRRLYRLLLPAQAHQSDRFVVRLHHLPGLRRGDRRLVRGCLAVAGSVGLFGTLVGGFRHHQAANREAISRFVKMFQKASRSSRQFHHRRDSVVPPNHAVVMERYMSIKDLILAALLAVSLPFAHAESTEPQAEPAASAELAAEQPEELVEEVVEEQEEQGMSEEEFLASLNFQTGKVIVGDNLASLNLPENLVFLDGEDANRVLVDAWGNPPTDELPLGMILPAGISPLADESWAVTVEFEESGFVSDEDAADIDYAEMLEQLQEETVESNAWRAENGYEPIELLGWAAQPHYDAQGKKLHWAKELRFGDSDINTLNYNIRVLGRKGVLVLNFIANMDQLPEIQANVPAVLAMTEFNDGSRYADFDPDIDQVAAYGIGALIAGKLAAKAGLFATALLLLKKFWLVPVLLFGWLAKRLTGKK